MQGYVQPDRETLFTAQLAGPKYLPKQSDRFLNIDMLIRALYKPHVTSQSALCMCFHVSANRYQLDAGQSALPLPR